MARPPKNQDADNAALSNEVQEHIADRHQLAATQLGDLQTGIDSVSLIYERRGARRALKALTMVMTAIDLAVLEQIKASKAYRGFVHTFEDGTSLTLNTWAEYCRYEESSSDKTIDDYLASYKTFGTELYDALRDVGLGPSKMRSLRQLPEDQQAQIAALAAMDSKADIAEMADTLISKHNKEKTVLKAKIEEQQQTFTAKEAVAANNRETIDDLQTQLQRAAQLPPDEIDRELREEAGKRAWAIETGLRGQLRPALQALNDNGNTNGIDVSASIAGLVNQIELALADIRLELNIMPSDALDDGMDWDVPPPASPETH